MTPSLHHSFRTTQAAHGAGDITTPNFLSQVNFMSICTPQVDSLDSSTQLSSISFGGKSDQNHLELNRGLWNGS